MIPMISNHLFTLLGLFDHPKWNETGKEMVATYIDAMVALAFVSTVALASATLLCVRAARNRSQRAAENQPSERNSKELRLLMDGVKDTAIYLLDIHGNVLTWNKGAARLKGYSSEEIIGRHFSRFYPESERAKGTPQRALNTALEGGLFEDFGQRVRKDGTAFFASVAIEPIFDENGKHFGFAKITRDISDLHRMQQHLDAAMNQMWQGLLLFDKNNRLVLNNRRLEELFHIKAKTLVEGLDLQEVLLTLVQGPLLPNQSASAARELYDLVGDLLKKSEGGDAVAEIGNEFVVSIGASRILGGGAVPVTLTLRQREISCAAHFR